MSFFAYIPAAIALVGGFAMAGLIWRVANKDLPAEQTAQLYAKRKALMEKKRMALNASAANDANNEEAETVIPIPVVETNERRDVVDVMPVEVNELVARKHAGSFAIKDQYLSVSPRLKSIRIKAYHGTSKSIVIYHDVTFRAKDTVLPVISPTLNVESLTVEDQGILVDAEGGRLEVGSAITGHVVSKRKSRLRRPRTTRVKPA